MMVTRVTMTPSKPADLTREEKQKIRKRSPKGLTLAALKGVNIILDRTEKGVGFEGPLKAYSPDYLKLKQSKGFSGIVDLNWTGNMLGSITVDSKQDVATLFFSRSVEAKKAAMNNKTRPFFGFNDKEENKLRDTYEKYVFAGFGKGSNT